MIHAFGAFELDTAARELRKSGLRRHVPPQVFRVLVHLVESEGRVVTRAELRSLVWGECTVVEFDQGLNFAIHRIRIVLDDSARSPRFVETLPKIGYRFLAPVVRRHRAPGGPGLLASEVLPSSPLARRAPRPRASRWLFIAACSVLGVGHAERRSLPSAESARLARAALERGFIEAHDGVAGQRRSIQLFREAQRLNPEMAEAPYAIAATYLELAQVGALEARSALARAREAADRAIGLDDRADTRVVRGWTRLQSDGDVKGALADFERAQALDSNNPGVLTAAATFHALVGSKSEALDLVGRAETLSPSCDLVAHDAGKILYRLRRFEAAMERYARAEELGTPRGIPVRDWRVRNREGALWARLAMSRDATADIARLLEAQGVSAAKIERWRQSGPDPTRRFLEGSVRRLQGQTGSTEALIRLHAALGHADEAIGLLRDFASLHSIGLLDLLTSPALDSLRTHPAFIDLRSKVLNQRSRPDTRTLLFAAALPGP